MSEEQNTLKWGDIVRIHGVNVTKEFQESSKGLILSKGFTDSNIYYQKYLEFDSVNFYRESLFQIMPSSNFDMHDELNDPANANSPNKESLRAKARSEIDSLNSKLKIAKQEKKNVLYGAEAIFRHVESNSYLRGSLKAADAGDGAFTIEVSPEPSSQIIWKIGSHRSYQHDGDTIYFDDQLLIFHVGTDCYMNFAENDKPIYLDTEEELSPPPEEDVESLGYLKCRPAIKKPTVKRISIINENKNKCLWKFIEHCKAEQYDNKEKIKSHDIVYFMHTKNKGCISSSLNGENYYLKETEDQKQCFDSYWELIPNKVNELGPEKCNDFAARNIITGKYLTYKGYRVSITSKEEVEGGGFISWGLVNLICSQDDRKLERGALIPKDPNQKPIIKFSENLFELYQLKDVEELTEDSFQIVKVEEEAMMNIQYIVSSQEHLVKFLDSFSSHMVKENADPKYKNVTEKDKPPRKVQVFDFITLNLDTLENVRYILELLAGKIYGTTYAEIVTSGNTPNPVIQKIIVETGTTELLIEGIAHLFTPFVFVEDNPEASVDRAQRVRLQQIFERIYRLLEKIVVGNNDNKFYLSRWVDIFLKHSKNINREYIQECLVGILQNNPKAIETTISPQEIEDLIRCFYKEARAMRGGELTTKYLRLFSTFIKCEDRVLKENQFIILEKFLKDPDNKYYYRFEAQIKEDEVEDPNDLFSKIRTKRVKISLEMQDFSPIPKYFKDWGPKWNYFLQFVNLLADVCMDKNDHAIENVSALVSLQTVTIILFDPQIEQLNKEIREINDNHLKTHGYKLHPIANVYEPFLRIAHYIYISNSKFTPIKTIKNISRWYRHQGEERGVVRKEDINRTKRPFEGEKEEEQKFYIDSILNFINDFISRCNQQDANLDILYTVLGLFKETVQLGLWESVIQFRRLIPMIIMRILKIENSKLFNMENAKGRPAPQVITMNKEGLSFNRPEILLNIQAKIKGSEIFKIMNELEIDIRLRYMMNFFKGLYEATESFQDYNQVEKLERIQEEQIRARDEIAREEFYKSDYANILGDVKKISEDQDIMLKENIWCNKFKELTPFVFTPQDDMSKNRYLFQAEGEEEVPFRAMVLALFELPVYKNDKLLSSSLKMLRSIFEQRKDLIDQFKDILVCGKGNLEEVYRTLKYMREKFEILTNPNILKKSGLGDKISSYYIQKTYDSSEKIPANKSGILQDLFFLSRTLKEDVNLKNIQVLMEVNETMFSKAKIYSYMTEKERNNKLFQAVNIAERIYQPLMTYIRMIGDTPPNPLHRKILFAIYHYLALLCFNNLEAKQRLMEYVPDILPHLKYRVGAANFLYHVSLNNKMLISHTGMVRKIIDGALEACIKLDEEDKEQISLRVEDIVHKNYEKSQILNALRGVLILNQEGYPINQQLMMNRFQDNKFKILIYKNRVEFTSRRDNFSLSPEESYVSCFFELFAMLVESKNFINIGKLQNIHPYPYCLECLKNTNRWQIRRTIRAYINRLYYVNKDRDVFLFEEFIRKEFKIINDQLEDLIVLHKNKLIHDEIVIDNGIRFKFAASQIIEMILEIFVTLHEILLKPEFFKVLKREIEKEDKKSENQREIHDQFKKLLHNLGCLNKLYPKNIISAFIKELYTHIEKVMLLFNEKYLERQSQQEGEIIAEEQDDLGLEPEKKNYVYDHSKSFFRNLACMVRDIKDREAKQALREKLAKREKREGTSEELKKLYIDLIFQCQGENLKPIVSKKYREVSSSLYKPHIQTANSRIFKVIAKPTLTADEENFQLNRRLTIVKDIIDDSPIFKKLKEDEFYRLVTTLTNINKTSNEYYINDWLAVDEPKPPPVVGLKEIFTKSFRLIMDHPDTISDREKIFVIKIARCYITEAVEEKQHYKLPVDKWGSEYYSGEEELPEGESQIQLVKRQCMIESCGGSEFLQCLIRLPDLDSKLELLNETLLLGIAYLFNGNTDCQDSLLNVMIADPQNMMLLNVKRLITTIGSFLIQIRKTKETGKLRKFAYKIIDTYDFFDVRNNIILKEFSSGGFDKFQARTEKAFQQALCRLFRFLHLFCENGNNGMKKFLLAQTNDLDGLQKKTNSVDFIEVTTLLLRKLFKIMNNKVVEIPETQLNFINEITQLPCLDNQVAFMKSTFFEDLSYLADFFVSEENLVNRKFNLVPEEEDEPVVKLRGIYDKGIELALCNFEGNSNILIWEFLTKCKPKFLWVVIKQNLMKILAERAGDLGVEKDEDMPENMFERNLLAQFTPEAIKKYTTEQVQESNMLNQDILRILSVLYILKKIEVYEEGRREVAFFDKDHPNMEELKKADTAKAFKDELIRHVKETEDYAHIEELLKGFDSLILSIEISSFNGKETGLQQIYFPKHPIFNYLNGDTRDSIMMRVIRGTQRDKQTSLLEKREEVCKQIELNYDLKYGSLTIPFVKKQFTFEITEKYAGQIRKVARNISFVICFMLMFFLVVDHDTEEMTSTFTYTSTITQITLRVAAGAQLLYTFWFVFLWLKLRRVLALNKLETVKPEGKPKLQIVELEKKKKDYKELQGWDLIVSYYRNILTTLQPFTSRIYFAIVNNWFIKNVIIASYALSQFESGFLSILMFVSATILGNFVGVQWYMIHLFDIFTAYPELTNIFKAILNNFKKLALLSFLAGVFILVFNVISLNTYTPVMWEDDLPEEACEDIVGCVLSLYTSGAIGDDMEEFEYRRFAFDIVYVVFMEMLFQNIVGGIMIDAFSSLKEEDGERDEDKKNLCYICGMDKTAMERSGSTFEKHTQRHCLWNYLYYLHCLELKPATDFTGLEFEIDKQVKEDNVDWFPAMGEGDSEGELQVAMEGLETDIKKMIEVMNATMEKGKTTLGEAKTALQKING